MKTLVSPEEREKARLYAEKLNKYRNDPSALLIVVGEKVLAELGLTREQESKALDRIHDFNRLNHLLEKSMLGENVELGLMKVSFQRFLRQYPELKKIKPGKELMYKAESLKLLLEKSGNALERTAYDKRGEINISTVLTMIDVNELILRETIGKEKYVYLKERVQKELAKAV